MLREMIQFLAQMPADTKIFLAVAVLGFGGNTGSAEMAPLPAVYRADELTHVALCGR
jgi:hypothetical protein